MRIRIYITLISVLGLSFSAPVLAHSVATGSGMIGVLLHPFSGFGHLLMLAVVGICISYFIKKQRYPNK